MAAPANGVYSFQSVQLSIVGPGISQIFTGAAGEGYSVTMEGNKDTITVGAAGDGMHSIRAGQNGRIMVRLMKTSAMNQAMSTLYNYQTPDPTLCGQNVLKLTDTNLGDDIVATGGGIEKFSDLEYGEQGNTNTWAFVCTYINQQLGSGGVKNLVANG